MITPDITPDTMPDTVIAPGHLVRPCGLLDATGMSAATSPRMWGRRATRGLVALCVTLLAVLMVAPTPAAAQEANQADCTFLEIKASSGSGGVAAELRPLQSKLKKPPFSAWKRFELVAKHQRTLVRMKAAEVALKAGGKLTTIFRQLSKSQGKKDRLSLSLALDDKSGKRALDSKVHVDSGDYFVIVVGQSADQGRLLAFTCKAR